MFHTIHCTIVHTPSLCNCTSYSIIQLHILHYTIIHTLLYIHIPSLYNCIYSYKHIPSLYNCTHNHRVRLFTITVMILITLYWFKQKDSPPFSLFPPPPLSSSLFPLPIFLSPFPPSLLLPPSPPYTAVH